MEANWADRMKNIRVRMAIATRVLDSVAGRVTILNAIFMPAVLFTANSAKSTRGRVTELKRVQKQFLWQSSTASEASRHKMNPELIFTPKPAGGLGLMSVQVALKRQAMKRAEAWLLMNQGEHTEAWHALAHPSEPQLSGCCNISPISKTKRATTSTHNHMNAAQWR